jgi:hypothetical protein
MDNDFLPPPDPVQIREAVMAQEADLRELLKDLHSGGHFEVRCLVRDAADKLLAAGRALGAEMPGRPPARPPARPALRIAN